MRCLECQKPYEPEPQNTTGFCSWDCFDVKPRPNAPEAFGAFLGDGVKMTRVEHSPEKHSCTKRCVCPIHGTPLIYAPALDDHACQDVNCVLGHGTAIGADRRYHFIQARWEHGHTELTDGCALCVAEYNEARTYTQGG